MKMVMLSISIGIMYDKRIEKLEENGEDPKSIGRNVFVNNDNGKLDFLLGVRKAESTYRANNIRAREIEGKLLVPHNDIENAYVYNPLTEIPNEEVWKFLLKGDAKSPWGSDNKYFFDGEKIADFFMNEGSNARIKEAFLTLCGYDTFDIMRRNFKRISGGSSTSAPALDAYWEAKQEAEQAQRMYQSLLRDLSECEDAIATCEADIAALEKAYPLLIFLRQFRDCPRQLTGDAI